MNSPSRSWHQRHQKKCYFFYICRSITPLSWGAPMPMKPVMYPVPWPFLQGHIREDTVCASTQDENNSCPALIPQPIPSSFCSLRCHRVLLGTRLLTLVKMHSEISLLDCSPLSRSRRAKPKPQALSRMTLLPHTDRPQPHPLCLSKVSDN